VPAMTRLFDEAEVLRWTALRGPFDRAAARAHLDRARVCRADGRGVQLAITTDGRTPLGEIEVTGSAGDGSVELAYLVGAAHRRRSLATRAVRLLTDHACRVLGANQVLLRIDPANTASVAVAHAAGFELTGLAPVRRAGSGPLLAWRRWAP
jgi:RimJ/RimL family protein N-acetyltransferase